MKTSKIVEYLKANHVDFNKDFERVETEGFIAEYDETVNSALEKLSKYIAFGVNNGFSEELNQGIKETTDVVVKICREKNTRNKNKFNDTLSRVETNLAKKAMKNDNSNGDNILQKILVYIKNYERAISVIKESNEAVRPVVLEEIVEKLSYLEYGLDDVVDASSEKALEHAKKILSLLNKMRYDVSNNVHDERTYSYLDEALEEADAWAKERVGVIIKKSLFKTKSNVATDTSALDYKENQLTTILAGKDSSKTLSLIRENIDNYKEIIEKRFSFQHEQEEMNRIQAEIDKLNVDLTDLLKKYQNGEMAPAIFTAMVKGKQSLIKEYESQLVYKNKEIGQKSSRYSLNYKVYLKLNRTIEVIENFSDEPAILNYLVKQIDVASLSRVMNGAGNEQDIERILNINFLSDSVSAKTQERLKDFLKMQEEQDKYLDKNFGETEEVEETNAVKKDAEKEEADKLVAQLLGKKPLVQTDSENPETEGENPVVNDLGFHDIKDEN